MNICRIFFFYFCFSQERKCSIGAISSSHDQNKFFHKTFLHENNTLWTQHHVVHMTSKNKAFEKDGESGSEDLPIILGDMEN